MTFIHAHDPKAVEFMYDSVFKMNVPIVMTLHVIRRRQLPWRRLPAFGQIIFLPLPLVYCTAVSEYQKKQYSELVNAENVVYHGIDVEEYPVKDESDKGSYLFTIGRITRDKGQDKAIEIAKKNRFQAYHCRLCSEQTRRQGVFCRPE